MSDKQGKGSGEGAVEKNTSRPNEQVGASSGSGGSGCCQQAADNVRKGRDQTRSDIGKTLPTSPAGCSARGATRDQTRSDIGKTLGK